jgi:cytochrome c553
VRRAAPRHAGARHAGLRGAGGVLTGALAASLSATLLVSGNPSYGNAAATEPAAAAPPAAAPPAAAGNKADAPAGVENPQRAWQNWTLNCQGCHRVDGTGSDTTAPSLAGTVAKFLWVPGGREYLVRVPGVAASPLSDADLAEVMNWMFWRFDQEHLPSTFKPFTAAEIGPLRARPLRLEAPSQRRDLLARAEAQGSPP